MKLDKEIQQEQQAKQHYILYSKKQALIQWCSILTVRQEQIEQKNKYYARKLKARIFKKFKQIVVSIT